MGWRSSLTTIVAVASLVAAAPPACAQTAVDSAARAVSRQLEAMRTGDYLTAARLTTTSELRRTRISFDSLLRADSANYIAHRFFRLDSTRAVEQLSDEAFTAGLMAFTFALRSLPAYFATTRSVDVAGGVPVGADTVIVVYRWRAIADSLTPREYNTATAIRCARAWCPASAGNYSSLLAHLRTPMVRMPVEVKVSPR
jgi:hypothetical protein